MPAGTSTESFTRSALRPRPWQTWHGFLATRPSPPQMSQPSALTTWPNGVRDDRPELSGALALRAGLDRGAGLGAVAAAVLAALDGLEGDLHLGAAGGLLEVDLGADGDIAAGRGPAWPAAAECPSERPAAEEGLEDVGDRAEALEVGGVAAAAQALVAVAVIGRAAVGVGQDLVGLGRLLELLLGLRVVAVDVGVQLAGELAKRLLDLGLSGVAGDAEHLVVVAGHLGSAHRVS